MDIELINKLDELINIFESSWEIKRIIQLKKQIYKDQNIKELLNKLNLIKNNVYNDEYLILKKELLDIDIIKEYKHLENELLLLTFLINQKLNNLVDKKRCHHESD